MALNKLTSLDKSGSSLKTETEDTVTPDTKKRSISSASSDDKNIKEKQPKEILFRKKLIGDNQSVSSMSVYGAIITTVSPDGECIPRKKKKEKLSKSSITGNKKNQDPENQGKKEKVGSSIYGKKIHVELIPPPNKNKQTT